MFFVEICDMVSSASQLSTRSGGLRRRNMDEVVLYTLRNEIEEISAVVERLEAEAVRLNYCDDDDRGRLRVALQEALANACYHGNLEVSSSLKAEDDQRFYDLAKRRSLLTPYVNRRIHVVARFSLDAAFFVIRDEGLGFDTQQLADPRHDDNLTRASGRGVFLMRQFMDLVRFNSTGNEVTLVKRRRLANA